MFENELIKLGINPVIYLRTASAAAKRTGYDPKLVTLAKVGVHKLTYKSPEGLKHFGRVGYGDFLIWKHKERTGLVPRGFANRKRYVFRTSHGALSAKRGLGKYSPKELAINVLW